ncbi:hypothetical protein EYR41_007919 [Orbilia oligospora]|uniref:Protein kinase domain-containing protein n=1 Tax=Orbilia oligospora TaxID=2813651 RepID=A0A8H2DV47_ORBOL|nr:hypothetical protein EYR41_007919 [Orbilia oligospora]
MKKPAPPKEPHCRYLYEWTDFETEVLSNISVIQRHQRLNSTSVAKRRQSVSSQADFHRFRDLSHPEFESEEVAVLRYSDFFTPVSSIWPQHGFPDLAFSTIQRHKASGSTNRFIGEVKSAWGSDIRECNIRRGLSKLLPLKNTIAQVITYMHNYKLRYGFFSTYKTYIFIKRDDDFRYLISVPISARQTRPTLRDCFGYLNYLTSRKGYFYDSQANLGRVVSGLLSSMTLENLRTDEKEQTLLDREVAGQLDRVQNILKNTELRNSLSRSRRNSLGIVVSSRRGSIGPPPAPSSRNASTSNGISGTLSVQNGLNELVYRQKSLGAILERTESPPLPTPKPKLPIPETRPLGHEIEKSGLPPHLFDISQMEPNKVFVKDEPRGITHTFKIQKCPESKGQDLDRGVYYTTYTGRPAVMKFFGDGLGWTALSMWQQECEARDKLQRTKIIPELYLAGEVILGRFGYRTCRGFAIIMERVDGETLSNIQMSPAERDEFQVAFLDAMILVRKQNMIHGEPSRSNVMWNRDQQRVVLLDWKEWWENEYGLEAHQRELEIIMTMNERVRRSSLKPV